MLDFKNLRRKLWKTFLYLFGFWFFGFFLNFIKNVNLVWKRDSFFKKERKYLAQWNHSWKKSSLREKHDIGRKPFNFLD